VFCLIDELELKIYEIIVLLLGHQTTRLMFPDPMNIDPNEADKFRSELGDSDFYLKNLAEYQRMLELLSLNEQLTNLLKEDRSLN
jgi:hypothetical protein